MADREPEFKARDEGRRAVPPSFRTSPLRAPKPDRSLQYYVCCEQSEIQKGLRNRQLRLSLCIGHCQGACGDVRSYRTSPYRPGRGDNRHRSSCRRWQLYLWLGKNIPQSTITRVVSYLSNMERPFKKCRVSDHHFPREWCRKKIPSRIKKLVRQPLSSSSEPNPFGILTQDPVT